MDTGRIKMENYHGVLFCDVYLNDEFSLNDLSSIREEIRRNYAPCTDLICMSTGSYSISIEVQKAALDGISEFRNVVYVAKDVIKTGSAEYAAATFMKPYNARVATTKEEAHELLMQQHDGQARSSF